MRGLKGLKGMRHIALNVKDISRSKAFYRDTLGMDVVWEPDAKNVYLSTGSDNLALHEFPQGANPAASSQQLDHLGFLVESPERVKELEHEFRRKGLQIVHPFKFHRDGSASFYFADPDGILIQMLYEPNLSRQEKP